MEQVSHPLEGLMRTTMESIREMVDVNTILGEPLETPDGTVILPISRVAFGFAAGGAEYDSDAAAQKDAKGQSASNGGGAGSQAAKPSGPDNERYPFGGGSGAGISLQPVAFLIVNNGSVRLLPVDKSGDIWNRLIDLAPSAIDKIKSALGGDEQAANATPAAADETELQ